jgi:hypothetical protein
MPAALRMHSFVEAKLITELQHSNLLYGVRGGLEQLAPDG